MNDTAGQELTFGQALEELEGILRRIEDEEIDVDQLAQQLKRGAELLELCRGKIRKTEVEVSQIVERMKETEPPAEPEDS